MSEPNPPNGAPRERRVAPGLPSVDSEPQVPPAPRIEEGPETAPGENSFAELLSEYEQQHSGEAMPGDTVEGTVVTITQDAVLVDVGRKREGILPLAEVCDKTGQPTVQVGDKITVAFAGARREGYYELSSVRAERPRDWGALERAFANQTVIAGVVTEAIKGGFRVDVGARAFLPMSRSGIREPAEAEALVGQEIRCKIIQFDLATEDVVVDRRVVLEQEAETARQQAFSALREGDVVRGTVRNLTEFGAFVDLGGVDGLLHVADLAWHRVNKPSDVLAEGEQIEVKILKIEPESGRISLGRKQLTPDPWSLAAEKYTPGRRVRGKVVRVTDFGAFVELEPGVDGLIHISEMSWSRKTKKPSDVVRRGDIVDAVVLTVNPDERRIGLGLKQALGDPWEDADKRYPPGSVHEVTITNLAKFGAFVELAEGVEGLIHIGDITREKRLNHPREALSEGGKVKAVVVELDRQRRRIRLGMKQLEPTSADEYIAEHKPGDVVTGRVIETGPAAVRVELGEGVTATCRLDKDKPRPVASEGQQERPDLATLTSMLSAKWKGGSATPGARGETPRSGQVRDFRILSLDARSKTIELELVE